jgi:hypothetical protein
MFNRVVRRVLFVAGLVAMLVLGAVETAGAKIPPDAPGPAPTPPPAAASSSTAWGWVLIGVGIVIAAALLLSLAIAALRRHRQAAPLRPRLP